MLLTVNGAKVKKPTCSLFVQLPADVLSLWSNFPLCHPGRISFLKLPVPTPALRMVTAVYLHDSKN